MDLDSLAVFMKIRIFPFKFSIGLRLLVKLLFLPVYFPLKLLTLPKRKPAKT